MQLRILLLLSFLLFDSLTVKAQNTVKMFGMDQPIVMGVLNGKKAYFLIDTGADVTMLNSKDTKKYKFQTRRVYSKNYKLSGLNSEHKGELLVATNIELNIGGQKMKGSYKVIDLSGIVKSLASDGRINISGIIGSDIMRKNKFIIDYEARKISFSAR